MTDSNRSGDETEGPRLDKELRQGPKKKAYRKPEFRVETVFETTALTCGKVQATQPQCHFNRKVS